MLEYPNLSLRRLQNGTMLRIMEQGILLRGLIYGGGFYLLLNLYAFLITDKLIFQPQNPGYRSLPNEVRIPTADDQTLNAVFLEAPNARHTLLFSHGNAEDLSNVTPFMQQFQHAGISVLMYDYRGYGTSDGRPSTRNAKQDVSAAYRWLIEEKKIAPESIIAHGRSLGGGVAVWLAANHKVGGLIVESSFVSTIRVKTRWPLLPWDKFNSLRAMKKITCPVLLIHGTEDRTVPFWHAKKLYNAAPEPKQYLWIENGRHNDYAYVAGEAYLESIRSFVQQLDYLETTPK